MVEIDTWVGIVLSLAGSFLVAPGALPEIGRRGKHTARHLHNQLARLLPFLHRSVPAGATVKLGVAIMADGAVAVDSLSVAKSGSLEDRVAYLAEELERVHKDLGLLRSDVETKDAAQRAALEALKRDALSRHEEIVRRIDEAEQEETKINAGALPVIGAGIVLSSGAMDIARVLWVNIVVLTIVVVFSLWVTVPVVIEMIRWRRAS